MRIYDAIGHDITVPCDRNIIIIIDISTEKSTQHRQTAYRDSRLVCDIGHANATCVPRAGHADDMWGAFDVFDVPCVRVAVPQLVH